MKHTTVELKVLSEWSFNISINFAFVEHTETEIHV